VVRSELDAHPGAAVDEHHVPTVFGVDRASEESSPEVALGGQVGGVEHDDLVVDSHRTILPEADTTWRQAAYRLTARKGLLERPDHGSRLTNPLPPRFGPAMMNDGGGCIVPIGFFEFEEGKPHADCRFRGSVD
jgi:hypothetical protein